MSVKSIVLSITTAELEAEIARRKEAAAAHPPPPAPAPLAQVHPQADGFREKSTPKKPDDGLFFFKCECGGIHYRHAGYVEVFIPFLKAGGSKELVKDQRHVMVCVKCRRSYIWAGEQMYEVTDQIDLAAWEKTEVEMQKATGPGGDC